MLDDPALFALVVDEDALIRLGYRDILDDAGFRCLEVENVEEAIELLEQHQDEVSLLFTDVHMYSDRDGFELARVTADRWPDISILVASGATRPRPGDSPKGRRFH